MKSFMIWLRLKKCFTDDQIKENTVDEACGVCGGKEECVQDNIKKGSSRKSMWAWNGLICRR